MKAKQLIIHNFRSIEDADVELSDYGLVVGPNNAGKSNLIAAVRAFYEKGLAYEEERDFPKFETKDNESWVEIVFQPSPAELEQLKDDYQLPDGTFRVRKYFKSELKDDEGKSRNGIYAYIGGELSGSRFYGAKNVQQGKFGELIFIPAASKLDDHTKLTGPSPLRDLLNSVLKGVLGKSPAYEALAKAVETFGTQVKTEESSPGRSLAALESQITSELESWDAQFALQVNSLAPDEIVKSLVTHRVIDGMLGVDLSSTQFGQGLQRHLIFVLIRLAASYQAPAEPPKKKEFSPSFTWIVFEEPEAFLHPTQMSMLDANLRTYSNQEGQQVTICTHSPQFASPNMDDLPALVRLERVKARSAVGQVRRKDLNNLLAANQSCVDDLKAAGIDISSVDETIEMEGVKYALWMNPLRAGAFFAERVFLVEGASEYALINYLLAQRKLSDPRHRVFVIDTLGKWNMHRFINLLGALRIPHSVLYDRDGGKPKDLALEKAILAAKNPFTRALDHFEDDLESFLGVPASTVRSDQKPQHLMWHLLHGKIPADRIEALCKKIQPVIDA